MAASATKRRAAGNSASVISKCSFPGKWMLAGLKREHKPKNTIKKIKKKNSLNLICKFAQNADSCSAAAVAFDMF